MEGDFPEDMKCPICYEIPAKEIYQCRNGHLVCHVCSNRVENCPQCSVVMETPRIRSRGVEDLLDMIKFNCGFKSEGCEEKLTRREVDHHTQTCFFGGEVLKLCGVLGLPCEYTLRTRDTAAGFVHLKSQHKAKICQFSEASIRFKDFAVCEGCKETNFWTPVIFCKKQSTDDDNFILLAQYNSVDKSVSFSCLLIRKNKTTKEAFVKIVIKSPDPSKTLDITWLTAAVPMSHASTQLNQGSLRTPVSILKTYMRNRDLDIQVTVCNAIGTSNEQLPTSSETNSVRINVFLLSNIIKPAKKSRTVASSSQNFSSWDSTWNQEASWGQEPSWSQEAASWSQEAASWSHEASWSQEPSWDQEPSWNQDPAWDQDSAWVSTDYGYNAAW